MHDPAIVTVDPDPAWPALYEAERRRLATALGPLAARIEHIGSTAVPGLPAKPIVDIDVYVAAIEPMAPYRTPLEALGYVFTFDPEFPDLHFFGWPAERPRRFHVHVAQIDSRHVTRDLAVRDFLRAHPDVAREYAALKRSLTRAHPGDGEAYVAGKAPFMATLEQRALAWRLGRTP